MTKLRTRRNLRIYKPNNTDIHWTFTKKIQGKKYYFQLHGTDRECKDLADKIDCHLHNNPIEETIAKFQPWKVAPPPSSPQFAEILDYLDSIADAVGIDASTLNSYRSSVRTLFSVATNSDPEKALNYRVADLTPKLFLKFKVAKLASAGADQENKQSAKRTVNRVLRSVKAIFSEGKVEVYPEHWNLSGIDEFRKCKPFPKVGKKYRLPEKDLILNTFNLWRDYESKDPDKYVSLGLALHFGLRRMEIWNCRRDWLNLDGDNCILTIRRERNFKPKSGEEGDTRGLTGAAEQILEVATGADYLMSHKGCAHNFFLELVKDLRGAGWDRKFPLHECRKLFGSFVSSTEGVFAAQKYLRHSSPQLTSDSYADLLVLPEIKSLWCAA